MESAFVGRQPIYDRQLQVFAYELLFRRHRAAAHAEVLDGTQATSQLMVHTFMDIGLDTLVGSHRAFFNLTRGFLTGEFPLPPPDKRIVLEVLEDIEPDAEVVAALRRLAAQGYTIALDDVVYRAELAPLIAAAHIAKVDLMASPRQSWAEQVQRLKAHNPNLKLLAEKVETHEEFEHCKALGFDYFQGYFLCRPSVVEGGRLPTNRLVILKLLAQLQDPEVDIRSLEELIVQDVPLAYRLLRFINSASFGLRREIESVRQAVALLGVQAIKNWASLMLLARIDDKPLELVTTALLRGRLCERLGAIWGSEGRERFFTVGLFSLLDAMMDRPLAELLAALPLEREVSEALLHHEGALGEVLRYVIAQERGEEIQTDQPVEAATFNELFVEAVRWVNEHTGMLHES